MITLNTAQKVDLTISATNTAGKPASVTGVPLWNSSNVNAVSLVVAADGLSAYAFGNGVGNATVSVIANAGTEAVPVQISASVDLTVSLAPATTLVITPSTVVSQ